MSTAPRFWAVYLGDRTARACASLVVSAASPITAALRGWEGLEFEVKRTIAIATVTEINGPTLPEAIRVRRTDLHFFRVGMGRISPLATP
jgi:hypothetical protein